MTLSRSTSSSPSSLDATITLSSSSDSMSSIGSSKERSALLVRHRRLVIGFLLVATFATLTWHSHLLHYLASVSLATMDDISSRSLYQSSLSKPNYFNDIFLSTYNATFARLQTCPTNTSIDDCLNKTFHSLDETAPWWFHSMLRDAQGIVSKRHHHLTAPVTGKLGIHFCSIGKIGTKQWRRVICRLQHKPSNKGRNVCIPDTPISKQAPKAVFLRDPLERFLSSYLDKCDSWHIIERHCEPLPVFMNQVNNTMTQGLKQKKKIMFETYVNTMALKWNTHFLPQSLFCDGLYRNLHTFDFVGTMGENFYQDLGKMGKQFGMSRQLQSVFQFENRTVNNGTETSATTRVLEYYAPRTVRRVLEYVAMDYVTLNMPIPNWAIEMLESNDARQIRNKVE